MPPTLAHSYAPNDTSQAFLCCVPNTVKKSFWEKGVNYTVKIYVTLSNFIAYEKCRNKIVYAPSA